jgi:hypothetical protein
MFLTTYSVSDYSKKNIELSTSSPLSRPYPAFGYLLQREKVGNVSNLERGRG